MCLDYWPLDIWTKIEKGIIDTVDSCSWITDTFDTWTKIEKGIIDTVGTVDSVVELADLWHLKLDRSIFDTFDAVDSM